MSSRITRKRFEKYLNTINDGIHKNYGTWLRRNDPIAFSVGFNEYRRERGGS